MKINIFSKILKNKSSAQTLREEGDASSNDETEITNFTESYLEAYFDGELKTLEERQLEGIFGERYVQEEMLKRGKLRNIISRQSVLSIPSAHDLKQEKKRVWNEIEHELRSHLSKPVKNETMPIFNLRESILRSLAAGSACLIVGLVYLNIYSKDSFYSDNLLTSSPLTSNNRSDLNRDYVLTHLRDNSLRVSSRLPDRDPVGVRELREFEKHNALIANLNSDELSDLGASIIRNEDFNSNMLTFVSSQGSYE